MDYVLSLTVVALFIITMVLANKNRDLRDEVIRARGESTWHLSLLTAVHDIWLERETKPSLWATLQRHHVIQINGLFGLLGWDTAPKEGCIHPEDEEVAEENLFTNIPVDNVVPFAGAGPTFLEDDYETDEGDQGFLGGPWDEASDPQPVSSPAVQTRGNGNDSSNYFG